MGAERVHPSAQSPRVLLVVQPDFRDEVDATRSGTYVGFKVLITNMGTADITLQRANSFEMFTTVADKATLIADGRIALHRQRRTAPGSRYRARNRVIRQLYVGCVVLLSPPKRSSRDATPNQSPMPIASATSAKFRLSRSDSSEL